MSEEEKVPKVELTLEERIVAIEHQSFLLYLQVNAITKNLVEDKKLITREELMADMEEIHKQVIKVTDEYVKQQEGVTSPPEEEPTQAP